MARMEAAACGIPTFGPVVERARLLRVAQRLGPALTVVCAPPGYGKSVFAAQCAAALVHDEVLWVPLYDNDASGIEWLGRAVDALSPAVPTDPHDERPPQFTGDVSRADLTLKARGCLQARAGLSVHLVLDGAGRVDSLEPLVELAALLRRHTTPASRLTVTCRSIATSDYVPDPAVVWMIGTNELRLSRGEIAKLVADADFDGDADLRAAELVDRFAGHPALVSLMLRHVDTDLGSNPPLDLLWHVQRLVAALPSEALSLPYCAALLREGSARELHECAAAIGDGPFLRDAAQVLAPLLCIESDDQGVPVRFRMHGVMCEVLTSSFPARGGQRIAAALRAGTLDHLTHIRDSARLQSVLLSACTVDEVTAYCEDNSSQLLRTVGPIGVERCLNRVPAVAISSSARLLLLRAAVLRESERPEEAALYASLARRIAEADGDCRTQTGAILLGVSAALEVVDLPTAREIIGQIDCKMRDDLDASALCLFESYKAVLDAYCADYASARLHLASATEMLGRVDTRAWEAVWATNSVAASLGQMQGRWDRARTLMVRSVTWPDITPLRRLQIRANTAVSSLELGLIHEAKTLLDGVLRETEDVALKGMTAYAMSTLADVLWDVDLKLGEDLYVTSQAMLAERGDMVGMAVEQAIRAMLRRAEGAHDESLALAETAAAQLCAEGSCASLFHVIADIEVAASLLALGDRWGARRIVARVLSDLTDSGAAMHLLLASLVMAEIERQEGDPDAAMVILRPHAEYVATGSANWRTAMYCRAFPGLLALLAATFGAEELPLRMLRLVPQEVISAAADSDIVAYSEGAHAVLAIRAMPAGTLVEPVSAEPHPPGPRCRVRLFGGFRIDLDTEPVADLHWRKRKVRLLFSMLATQSGQDLPRDVLLERLWPDMDAERARRNFYVTWSAMKRALANGAPPSSSDDLVRCAGGVCGLTNLVRTDLEDFEEVIRAVRATAPGEDAAAVVAGRHLCEVYKGDLLPGDIYEDWFSGIRERARHDFCDAMVIAARAAEQAADLPEALQFLRRASMADPWREDIYQALIRCQMNAGQRSLAIETYIACRGRLVEDLGIDPSLETTRLYETVLAMESESPSRDKPSNY